MLIVFHNAISCDKREGESENMNEWSAVLFHFLHPFSSACRVVSILRSSFAAENSIGFLMHYEWECKVLFYFYFWSNIQQDPELCETEKKDVRK